MFQLSQQTPRVLPTPEAGRPVHVYAHPSCQERSSPPHLLLGNYLPALQIGIVLLPPWARVPSEKSAASALPVSPRRGLWTQEGGAGHRGCPRVPATPWAPSLLQACRQLRRAGARGPLRKRDGGEGRLGRCRTAAFQRNGSQQPPDHRWLHQKGPSLLPSSGPWWPVGTHPILPREGGKAGRVGGRAGRPITSLRAELQQSQ